MTFSFLKTCKNILTSFLFRAGARIIVSKKCKRNKIYPLIPYEIKHFDRICDFSWISHLSHKCYFLFICFFFFLFFARKYAIWVIKLCLFLLIKKIYFFKLKLTSNSKTYCHIIATIFHINIVNISGQYWGNITSILPCKIRNINGILWQNFMLFGTLIKTTRTKFEIKKNT